MIPLYDILVNYIRKYEKEPNSYATTETHILCDHQRKGTITLKWWKETGTLLISHIRLDAVPNGPKYVLTDAVNALKNAEMESKGLKMVKLIGVANSSLSEKMVNKGWDQSDDSLYIKI